MTDEIPSETPLIDIVVPNGGGRITISRVESIAGWLESEQGAWQGLMQHLSSGFSGNNPITSTISTINREHEMWFDSLRTLGQRVNGEPRRPMIEDFERDLVNRYASEFRKPLSNSLIFNHIRQLSTTSPAQAVAAIALVWHVSVLAGMQFLCLSGGLSLLLADEHGRDPQSWRNALVTVVEEARNKSVQLESQYRGIAQQFGDLTTQQGNFMQERQKEWQQYMERCEAQKRYIESVYNNDLATRAAVNYWQDREKSKKRDRIVALIATVALMITTLVAALFWPLITQKLGLPAPSPVSTDGKTLAPLTEVLQFLAGGRVLAIVLGIWCIRLCVRNYLAALHQGADAAERAVMVQTYLALLRDEEVAKNPEITKAMLPAMLTAIFRHASDGYVRDDGIPLATPALPGVPKT
ncbi:MAG: DUF6161 domain-containing protein [Planctomycetaceae bacterium]